MRQLQGHAHALPDIIVDPQGVLPSKLLLESHPIFIADAFTCMQG
jgi:hypothetical protein